MAACADGRSSFPFRDSRPEAAGSFQAGSVLALSRGILSNGARSSIAFPFFMFDSHSFDFVVDSVRSKVRNAAFERSRPFGFGVCSQG